MTPDKVFNAVAEVMAGPIIWGQSDCCSAVAAVYARLWAIDLMSEWRSYASARAACRALADRGSDLSAAVAQSVVAAGLVPCVDRPGAIGLVTTQSTLFGDRMAAICVEPGVWAARTEDGFGVVPDARRVWGLPCPH